MHNKTMQTLSRDQLDAIATYAGCLAVVVRLLDEKSVMAFFEAECNRLETAACDELLKRGEIINFDDDIEGYASAD